MSFNVLFTSAGRRVSLIRNFRAALDGLGLAGKLVTADLQTNAPAPFVADQRELVPRVSDPAYIDTLLEICRRHDIKLVVPLIDTELPILAPHREDFARAGVTLLVSSTDVNRICFDKRQTARFFRSIGVDTPAIIDPASILSGADARYPYLLKPAAGSSSVGVTKINDARELAFFLEYVSDPIVQEFIRGEEYTLDILVDFAGKVRSVVPRLRIETRAGEVSKGLTVKNRAIIEAGRRVAESLPGALGCVTVQCFLTPEGRIVFIEINPRFGGGFPLAAAAGADFPRWIIEMMLGRYCERPIDAWQDDLAMLRYDEGIFVEGSLIR
ncbi:ATP-grasp domain-containing protein [Geomonas sp.]|uniref:ATP-grasp domain-containing protein n=1 Tax=Geomonas sp. TaxID=2651584 RepID=UPI002B49C36E|nr:ATP-grasp domain-containing protein [Geomonas sp.]HJV35988.1 ATP-grasp domain-containing protein [Geomonas sp.]